MSTANSRSTSGKANGAVPLSRSPSSRFSSVYSTAKAPSALPHFAHDVDGMLRRSYQEEMRRRHGRRTFDNSPLIEGRQRWRPASSNPTDHLPLSAQAALKILSSGGPGPSTAWAYSNNNTHEEEDERWFDSVMKPLKNKVGMRDLYGSREVFPKGSLNGGSANNNNNGSYVPQRPPVAQSVNTPAATGRGSNAENNRFFDTNALGYAAESAPTADPSSSEPNASCPHCARDTSDAVPVPAPAPAPAERRPSVSLREDVAAEAAAADENNPAVSADELLRYLRRRARRGSSQKNIRVTVERGRSPIEYLSSVNSSTGSKRPPRRAGPPPTQPPPMAENQPMTVVISQRSRRCDCCSVEVDALVNQKPRVNRRRPTSSANPNRNYSYNVNDAQQPSRRASNNNNNTQTVYGDYLADDIFREMPPGVAQEILDQLVKAAGRSPRRRKRAARLNNNRSQSAKSAVSTGVQTEATESSEVIEPQKPKKKKKKSNSSRRAAPALRPIHLNRERSPESVSYNTTPARSNTKRPATPEPPQVSVPVPELAPVPVPEPEPAPMEEEVAPAAAAATAEAGLLSEFYGSQFCEMEEYLRSCILADEADRYATIEAEFIAYAFQESSTPSLDSALCAYHPMLVEAIAELEIFSRSNIMREEVEQRGNVAILEFLSVEDTMRDSILIDSACESEQMMEQMLIFLSEAAERQAIVFEFDRSRLELRAQAVRGEVSIQALTMASMMKRHNDVQVDLIHMEEITRLMIAHTEDSIAVGMLDDMLRYDEAFYRNSLLGEESDERSELNSLFCQMYMAIPAASPTFECHEEEEEQEDDHLEVVAEENIDAALDFPFKGSPLTPPRTNSSIVPSEEGTVRSDASLDGGGRSTAFSTSNRRKRPAGRKTLAANVGHVEFEVCENPIVDTADPMSPDDLEPVDVEGLLGIDAVHHDDMPDRNNDSLEAQQAEEAMMLSLDNRGFVTISAATTEIDPDAPYATTSTRQPSHDTQSNNNNNINSNHSRHRHDSSSADLDRPETPVFVRQSATRSDGTIRTRSSSSLEVIIEDGLKDGIEAQRFSTQHISKLTDSMQSEELRNAPVVEGQRLNALKSPQENLLPSQNGHTSSATNGNIL